MMCNEVELQDNRRDDARREGETRPETSNMMANSTQTTGEILEGDALKLVQAVLQQRCALLANCGAPHWLCE